MEEGEDDDPPGAASVGAHVAVRVAPFVSVSSKPSAEAAPSGRADQKPRKPCLSLKVGVSGQCTTAIVQQEHFMFDRCYSDVREVRGAPATQLDVYKGVGAPVVDAAWEGQDVCVLAYGQTGSGKSHAMVGTGFEPWTFGTEHEGASDGAGTQGGMGGDGRGLLPRIAAEVFSRAERERAGGVTGELRVEVAMFELYCERVRDLLKPGHAGAGRPDLRVRDRPNGAVVEGLRTCAVTTFEHLRRLLADGMRCRAVADAAAASQPSRAHCVVQLTVTRFHGHPGPGSPYAASSRDGRAVASSIVDDSAMPPPVVSRITLVDTAGSEQDDGGDETTLNRSLVALNRVIAQLAGGSGGSGRVSICRDVDYGASALTLLLREHLSGRSRIFVLATVSPAEEAREETTRTLRFAATARSLRARPARNVDVTALEAAAAAAECAAAAAALERLRAQQSSARAEARALTSSTHSTPTTSPLKPSRPAFRDGEYAGSPTREFRMNGMGGYRTSDGGGSPGSPDWFKGVRGRTPPTRKSPAARALINGGMIGSTGDYLLQERIKDAQARLEASERRRDAAAAGWTAKLDNFEQARAEFASLGEPWRAMSTLPSGPTAGCGPDTPGRMLEDPGSWIPRLVTLHEDPAMTERVSYVLKEGRTRVGAASTSDVVLTGLGMKRAHCILTLTSTRMSSGEVLNSAKLRPFTSDADVFVNGRRLGGAGVDGEGLNHRVGEEGVEDAEKTLRHGDRVVVGASHVFRYHDPAYAAVATAMGAAAREPADWRAAQEELRRPQVVALLAAAGPPPVSRDESGNILEEGEAVRGERRRRWREELSRRALRLLPLVDEANGMCREMGIHVAFAPRVVSHDLIGGGGRDDAQVSLEVDARRQTADAPALNVGAPGTATPWYVAPAAGDAKRGSAGETTPTWSEEAFANRCYMLQDIYQSWLRAGKDVGALAVVIAAAAAGETGVDPLHYSEEGAGGFEGDEESGGSEGRGDGKLRYIGSATLATRSLLYGTSTAGSFAVAARDGTPVGHLVASLVPCTSTGEEDAVPEVDDPSVEMLGQRLFFHVKITAARGLPRHLCRGVRVRYRHDDGDGSGTKWHSVRASQAGMAGAFNFSGGGDFEPPAVLSTSPAFGDYERRHTTAKLTRAAMDRLARGAMTLEVWGAPLEPVTLSLAEVCPAAASAYAEEVKAAEADARRDEYGDVQDSIEEGEEEEEDEEEEERERGARGASPPSNDVGTPPGSYTAAVEVAEMQAALEAGNAALAEERRRREQAETEAATATEAANKFEEETKRLNGQVSELVRQVSAGMTAAEVMKEELVAKTAALETAEVRAAEAESAAAMERKGHRESAEKLSEALEVAAVLRERVVAAEATSAAAVDAKPRGTKADVRALVSADEASSAARPEASTVGGSSRVGEALEVAEALKERVAAAERRAEEAEAKANAALEKSKENKAKYRAKAERAATECAAAMKEAEEKVRVAETNLRAVEATSKRAVAAAEAKAKAAAEAAVASTAASSPARSHGPNATSAQPSSSAAYVAPPDDLDATDEPEDPEEDPAAAAARLRIEVRALRRRAVAAERAAAEAKRVGEQEHAAAVAAVAEKAEVVAERVAVQSALAQAQAQCAELSTENERLRAGHGEEERELAAAAAELRRVATVTVPPQPPPPPASMLPNTSTRAERPREETTGVSPVAAVPKVHVPRLDFASTVSAASTAAARVPPRAPSPRPRAPSIGPAAPKAVYSSSTASAAASVGSGGEPATTPEPPKPAPSRPRSLITDPSNRFLSYKHDPKKFQVKGAEGDRGAAIVGGASRWKDIAARAKAGRAAGLATVSVPRTSTSKPHAQAPISEIEESPAGPTGRPESSLSDSRGKGKYAHLERGRTTDPNERQYRNPRRGTAGLKYAVGADSHGAAGRPIASAHTNKAVCVIM